MRFKERDVQTSAPESVLKMEVAASFLQEQPASHAYRLLGYAYNLNPT
jgi:hypothetical protein